MQLCLHYLQFTANKLNLLSLNAVCSYNHAKISEAVSQTLEASKLEVAVT